MAEIGFRPLDVRDQHGQGVNGDSSYLSLGQHSKKRAGPKRRPRGAEQDSTDMELVDLCCIANVLITRNNRSWREAGISVELQSRGSEWVISVQINGVIRSHKVLESTINSRVNRYTHAMMWKGGDDWTLEFSDRTHWTRFKGMHEECSNRNARAAFVKQIPIPSVKQIPDSIEGKHIDCPRFWANGGQWPGEVETALNCSTRVYDMDSEDENWLAEVNKRASTEETMSVEAFERIIDKLERITYLRQGEMVVTDEVAELCENLASENAVLLVHAYWFNKRLIRENALIRYFESPLWRKYRKQCDNWEARINELQQMLPHETKEELHEQYPKPPLFAFCLPSRGLDASNSSKRVQRQRSQKHLNSSFKYTRTSSFETPEESQRVSQLRFHQRGHDSLLVSAYEKGDFWQRKMSRDGFFEQLISNLSPHTTTVVSHKSLEDAQANAAAARQLAQMYFLRFNSSLQRAVAAVIEFEAIYFAELALINLKCESAVASCEQLLFFRRRMECVLNQFFSLSGKEDFLSRDGNHSTLSDDGNEGIDDDDDDNDPLCTVSMQADGFGGSPLSDDFLRDEGSFLSISERAHLEAWMRSTLRQRAR